VDKSVTRESLPLESAKLLNHTVEVMLRRRTEPIHVQKVGIGDDNRPSLPESAVGDETAAADRAGAA
jgi:hypothetical protein